MRLPPPKNASKRPFTQQQKQSRPRRARPKRTPMTMPAMAPPERLAPLDEFSEVRVMFAPVATGVSKGTVVVGLEVTVAVVTPEVVPRMAALAVAPGVVYVE